jgi:putative restriction endonuclease
MTPSFQRPEERHGNLGRPMPFGEIVGNPEGTTFADRAAVRAAGVHAPLQAGIAGSALTGAESLVVSGGYEDDEDYGDLIIYTGAGGRGGIGGPQIEDQIFEGPNLALVKSAVEGLPVRVVRGARGEPAFSPASGYRYDGLFSVTRYWREDGRAGHLVCRYELRKILEDGSLAAIPPPALPPGPAQRTRLTTERVVRTTQVVRRVKELHGNRCQVCGEMIETPAGGYAEGAHIRPLGRPHDGPDVESNVICLCPNDHARFDYGAIVLTDTLEILDAINGTSLGQLTTAHGHAIDLEHVRYHREHFIAT